MKTELLIAAGLVVLLVAASAVGFVVGYVTAEVHEARIAHVVRALPVAWSNVGTCGAEALGDNFVRWTCRIEQ